MLFTNGISAALGMSGGSALAASGATKNARAQSTDTIDRFATFMRTLVLAPERATPTATRAMSAVRIAHYRVSCVTLSVSKGAEGSR
jgi:hypothetical protein